jgi:hypothetical protein
MQTKSGKKKTATACLGKADGCHAKVLMDERFQASAAMYLSLSPFCGITRIGW